MLLPEIFLAGKGLLTLYVLNLHSTKSLNFPFILMGLIKAKQKFIGIIETFINIRGVALGTSNKDSWQTKHYSFFL